MLLMISVSNFAQNFQSMNNMMNRQQSSVAAQAQRNAMVLMPNHGKSVAQKQKQIDSYNKLISDNDTKIADIGDEIEILKIDIEESDNKQKLEKKIKQNQNELNALKKEQRKLKSELSLLENEIAASEK